MTFSWKIFLAAKWIKSGYIIAYPTESVYGLGCDPKNLDAVKKILQIKQRSYKKGLILVASNVEQIIPYINKPSPQVLAKLAASSNQVITWLIPANKNISPLLTGKNSSEKKIAIRISNHPIIQSLCQQLGHPIISTSANLSGKAMLYSANKVKLCFKNRIKYILNGPLGRQKKPSQIRDIMSNKQIRK
ncbi:MAG: L-threonylcarbamoyladenylate synthase [Pseudomonadota bacterium]